MGANIALSVLGPQIEGELEGKLWEEQGPLCFLWVQLFSMLDGDEVLVICPDCEWLNPLEPVTLILLSLFDGQ